MVGIFAASGVGWIVGNFWRAAQMPVFLVLAIWWLWGGWRYAQARDRGDFRLCPQLWFLQNGDGEERRAGRARNGQLCRDSDEALLRHREVGAAKRATVALARVKRP